MLISELSAATGASPRSLRYYEQRGLVQAERLSNGYRDYGDEAVDAVARIRGLLELGLPTELIEAVLPCANGTDEPIECSAIDARVRGIRDDMDARIGRLVATSDLLDRRLSASTDLRSVSPHP